MAFVSITERRGERSQTTAASINAPSDRTHELEWTVLTDDPLDNTDTVQLFDEVQAKARLGKTYTRGNDADLGSWCNSVEVEADPHNDLLYIVRAGYSNKRPDVTASPMNRPAVWSPYLREIEMILPYDWRGQPYTNPAGDPFDDPPPTIVSVTGFRIAKNFTSYNPWGMAVWNKVVNTDVWFGAAPGFAQVAGIVPSELKTEGAYSFYTLVTSVELNPWGWLPVPILNKGSKYLKVAGDLTSKTLFATDDGVHDDHEGFLAANGTKLADGAPETYTLRYPFPEGPLSGLPI